PAVFEAEIARLEALLAERTQATIASATPYLAFAAALQRRIAADTEVANTIAELLEEKMPPELASLIRSEWAQVLQSIAREEGSGGPAWAEQLEVIRKLRWSINPMQTPEQRKQLAGQVPAIIRGLNAGFDRIQLPQADRDRILDLCFALQTAALRGGASVAPLAASAASTTPVDYDFSELAGPDTALTLPSFETLALEDGRQLKVWRGERKEGDAATVPLEMLSRIGDWLELKLPDGTLVRGLWTRTDDDSGQILLQNPDWDYALLLAPDVLKYQLRSKQARVLRARSLFEEAASKALQHARS
ncbi:MAG TPA: DUF1631 family protein, partial [Rhodocyclaceae bacterium]|nr:DUF1631 family protein [Rhodocyclaceae bacterium]